MEERLQVEIGVKHFHKNLEVLIEKTLESMSEPQDGVMILVSLWSETMRLHQAITKAAKVPSITNKLNENLLDMLEKIFNER